ncbi:MAG: BACON domain-containing protein [Muribaculaceae bacterium]|nr:BACON domain-containing protein [Muribaculaceae bacterium]
MKLKYIIPSFIAILATLVGCSDIEDSYLDEIRVSTSYVSIDLAGGSQTIDIQTLSDWSLDVSEIPEWLTVTPASGSAGKGTITFSAEEAPDGRTAELHITSAGRTQNINVIQGVSTVSEATCAEVIAGPESKTYRVTGTITSWGSNYEKYGNMNIADETGTIYIYGMADKNGNLANNPVASWGLEIGDVITVEGPKTVYNGTVELVDVTVVNIQKSLIKVESTDPADATVSKEGGEVTVNLSCKGNGVSVVIPDDAKEWLSISSIISGDAPVVVFRAAANNGGARSSKVTFKTTDASGKEYTAETTISQAGSIVEATVAEFLAAEVGETQYRMTGIITELYSSDSQGKSFYIRDYSGTTLVYRAEGFIESGAKVGDVVTVVGKRGAYKENPQMVSGQLEEVKYSVQTISIADFRNLPDDKEAYYMISGEIVTATEENTKNDVEQYGNFNLKDNTGEVYIYGVLTGWGGQKGQFGELNLTWGDKLTIIAYKTSYKGLVEGVGVYISSQKQ